jgi:hypothetical protein
MDLLVLVFVSCGYSVFWSPYNLGWFLAQWLDSFLFWKLGFSPFIGPNSMGNNVCPSTNLSICLGLALWSYLV